MCHMREEELPETLYDENARVVKKKREFVKRNSIFFDFIEDDKKLMKECL